jgi:hypothetical protein
MSEIPSSTEENTNWEDSYELTEFDSNELAFSSPTKSI